MRVGVIGVGRFGSVHARVWATMPDVDCVGVHDPFPGRAQRVADATGATVFADLDDLLANVDAVSIAVPYARHREIAERALRGGCHILLEKPFTARAADALAIQQIAQERGRVAYAGYIERELSDVAGLASTIAARHYESRRLVPELQPGQDEILELMVHDFHHALRLFQPSAAAVSATAPSPFRSEVEVRFSPFGSARLTAGDGGQERVMRFDGDDSATLDLGCATIRAQNPLRKQFARFLQAIGETERSGQDHLAVAVLRLAEAAMQARETGETLHVAL